MASLFTKTLISAALLCAVGASHALAKLTPPSISNINQYGVTDERSWNKDKAAEVRGTVGLTADREVRGLHIYEPDLGRSRLHLNGKKLIVGEEGLYVHSFIDSRIEGDGIITSSASNSALNFHLEVSTKYVLQIHSVIADNLGRRIGLDISGDHGAGWGEIGFYGNKSNTFTGDVNISGHNLLALIKTGGASSILGNISVKDGAMIGVFHSNQISDSSTLTLKSNQGDYSTFYFSSQHAQNISEKIHKLVVDGGAVLNFDQSSPRHFPHGQRHLYLDDLEIKEGSTLFVKEWAEGRDHILVRRDSEHLEESLKRMHFEGYDPNAVHLEDYDKDYWEINAMPEPATYGAGLSLVALGLARYRRQRS